MALIKKTGNQIYKIYSPEMDISRSSLLSVSNDIAALTSQARLIYRYDNKLEDYDIVWVDYNDLNDAVEMWYKVPTADVGAYYLQPYIRKTLYWDNVLRLTEVIRYHESDTILKRMPIGVDFDATTNKLTNNGIMTASFNGGDSFDIELDVLYANSILPNNIDIIISSYLHCKFRNISLDKIITISAGTYTIADSGFIIVDTDVVIQPGETLFPIPYNEQYRFLVPTGGLAIPVGDTLDISSYLVKKTQSERKATHHLGYDSKNRMVTSEFRDGE